jgi:hypothetical protein
MLDLGGRSKILPDQPAPFGEILRAAEIDGVILEGLPFGHQAITLRLLDRAMQLEAVKSLGAAEGCAGLGDRRLKILFGAGLDVDLCDFGDHRGRPFAGELTSLAQPVAKKKGAWRRPGMPVSWATLS